MAGARAATPTRAPTTAPRIVLADDHAMVRQSLRLLLERDGLEVVGEAGDGREAVRLVKRFVPDLAVLDLAMPYLNGIEAARRIRRIRSAAALTRTILLSAHSEAPYVRAAVEAGAEAYVLKSQAVGDLLQAIRAVLAGGTYFSPALPRAEATTAEGARRHLSRRQRQLLQLVGRGRSTGEIAKILGISLKTAEAHRTALMRKLGVHRAADLVRLAVRLGAVDA